MDIVEEIKLVRSMAGGAAAGLEAFAGTLSAIARRLGRIEEEMAPDTTPGAAPAAPAPAPEPTVAPEPQPTFGHCPCATCCRCNRRKCPAEAQPKGG